VFEPDNGDQWAFMYLTTGGMTGIIIAAIVFIRPPVFWIGRVAVFVAAVTTIVCTLPRRKGLAVALDYITRHEQD
jgi:hypothetical protein